MRAELLRSGYAPGQSIIIGEQHGKGVRVDGIILHTAFCLSGKVSLLEDAKVEDGFDVIYLCGHGNLRERTIGGRSLAEIADLLIKAGYQGRQAINLIACSAKEEYHHHTMVGLLEDELNHRLHRVTSEAVGTIVTLKNDKGAAENWLLDCDKAEMEFLQRYQDRLINGGYRYRIRKSSELAALYQGCGAAMARYKEKLIRGEITKKT
ncbi:MAG: hypothetical protein H6Q60_1189 [Oscillospiraceae bacterium]|nr:hypothetical protein [Oscillospiraceae bacterium]